MRTIRESALAALTRRIEPLAAEGVEITEASTLDGLGFDSLDRLSLAYGLEEEFHSFNGDEVDWTENTTVGAIADQLVKLAERHK